MATAADVAAVLKRATLSGDGYTARCPAHDDSTPSLSFKDGEHGVVVHCFAGCLQEAVLDAVAALGVELRRTNVNGHRTKHIAEPGVFNVAALAHAKQLSAEKIRAWHVQDVKVENGAPAVGFEYRNRNGAVTGMKTRRRLNRTPLADRGFTWSKGKTQSLYGLWRSEDMRALDGRLVLCEGETDALTLWEHDFFALGLPNANKWEEQWLAELPDNGLVYVIIEPDQGGKTIEAWLATSELRHRARLVRMPKEHKDPSALYLADTEHFAERFEELLAAAAPWSDELARMSVTPSPLADRPAIVDSDLANAKRFSARYGTDLRFTPERGWLVWDGRRWTIDEKGIRVQEMAKKTVESIFGEIGTAVDRDLIFRHAKHSQSKRAIEAMIWLVRSEPGIRARLTDFDRDGWLFNVANGTVDLRTGDLRSHERSDLISNFVNVAFDRSAECELWDSFLHRVTDRNEDLNNYIRRFAGYLLVGDTTEQALHFLHGLGANGKSVFCEVVMRLLGDYAIAVSPDLIMMRRHGGIPNDIARLRGIRAAFMNETAQGARFDEAKLKELTGGDTLTGRFLHAEFFDFTPTHRLVIRGNHKPAIYGTDDGIWRRLRLLPFTVQIPGHEQDRDLGEKLGYELPGILQWAIRGCLEWETDGLNPPPIITEAVRAYREESDVLALFLAERCEMGSMFDVRSGDLFGSYQRYCEAAAERWISQKELPAEMIRRGFIWKRTKRGGIFQGLKLNATEF